MFLILSQTSTGTNSSFPQIVSLKLCLREIQTVQVHTTSSFRLPKRKTNENRNTPQTEKTLHYFSCKGL